MQTTYQVPNSTASLTSVTSNVRCFTHSYLYTQPGFIDELSKHITSHIDNLMLDYNASEKCFTVKIKKTTLKKIPGFEHNVDFYYTIMGNVFREFFTSNREYITINMASIYGGDYINILNYLFMGNNIASLFNIRCFADNIVKIYI